MKKLTYKEIRDMTGISIGTISRYFNNGQVSKKNKDILDEIVTKYNFTPSISAQAMKKVSTTIIVLIPNSISVSNYLITTGIIKNFHDVICVYYENNFNSFTDKFRWACGSKNIGIVVFPPFNQYEQTKHLLSSYKETQNIVVYDLNVPNIGSVTYDISESLKTINDLNNSKNLHYIYSNNHDHTFVDNLNLFEKTFKSYSTSTSLVEKIDSLILFQYNDLLKSFPAKLNNENLIIISMEYNWYHKPKYWIEINFEEIGKQMILLILSKQRKVLKINSSLHVNFQAQFNKN